MCVLLRTSPCCLAKAAELQHGDIQHAQEKHECQLWHPGYSEEERQGQCAHHTGQEGVACAVTRQLSHGAVGATVHVDDHYGAVGVGTTPHPGHAAHLTQEQKYDIILFLNMLVEVLGANTVLFSRSKV